MSAKKKRNINSKSINLSKILLFSLVFLLLCGVFYIVYLKITSKNTIETDINVVTSYGNCNSPYESKWGEWCVYTWTDRLPDKLIANFENIYHPSVYYRNGKYIMFVGGWKNGSAQGWHDKIYKFETTDKYGIGGWNLVKNPQTGSDVYIDNNFENTSSFNPTTEIKSLLGNGNPYNSTHSVQPSFFPYENLPGGQACCDALFYSYDAGSPKLNGQYNSPETFVLLNTSYIDGSGIPRRAGTYGAKNPILSYKDYWTNAALPPLGGVLSISDAHSMYDPKTKKFYLVYTEWRGRHANNTLNVTLGLASGSWTNSKFYVSKSDLIASKYPFTSNPQIVLGNSGRYYLFYVSNTSTNYAGFPEIRVSYSDNITGPYIGDKVALSVPQGFSNKVKLTTPYVMCNKVLNRWQMYFAFSSDGLNNNQIYTAFLEKNCSQDPY